MSARALVPSSSSFDIAQDDPERVEGWTGGPETRGSTSAPRAFLIFFAAFLCVSCAPSLMKLPTGAGLLSFATEDDALAAVEDVRADYDRHVHAARNIAEQHFDSRKVLTRFLERVGATS